MRNYINIFKIDDIILRKNELDKKIKKDTENNKNFIKELYIEITKLLTIDNTNIKLLEIYLLFIKSYEKELFDIFTENNIEKYDNEVEYYSVCFTKENYKILFNRDKEVEKDQLFKFLKDIDSLNNFNYDDKDFINFIEQFKMEDHRFPDFNQPIEFDCDNEELLWFFIKMRIFSTFLNLKLEQNNQKHLDKIRKGCKYIFENKLFEDKNIINDKYKLQSTVYLIIIPCAIDDNSLEFFCNSIQCKRNKIDELKKDYKINDENLLEYEGEKYNNIEDICIKNLPFKEYEKEEKYNFTFLMNNYVKNQDEIKQFLKNILKERVFVDVFEILFGNRNSKLLDERYLEELIDNRLKFAPIRAGNTLAVSDKFSFNTLLSTKRRVINNNNKKISLEPLTEILNTSNHVLNGEHEAFHILNCIPYYENNCSILMETPRKNEITEKDTEGGLFLELLLFNKIIEYITLADALFILNEDNYKKSLSDFKNTFEKKNYDDLIIKGVFSKFNDYLDIKSMSIDELNNSYINQKLVGNTHSLLNSYIITYLNNDTVGRKRKNK